MHYALVLLCSNSSYGRGGRPQARPSRIEIAHRFKHDYQYVESEVPKQGYI